MAVDVLSFTPAGPELQPRPRGRPRAERTRAIIAPIEPLAVGAEEAAALCGIGKTLWGELDSSGKIPAPLKLGSRCVWYVQELRAWMAAGCLDRERWNVMKKDVMGT